MNNPQPRLYPNLVGAVIECIETIFGREVYAAKAVERILKSNKKWGARDRAFVAESTYEIVRHWRYLWALLGQEPKLKRKSLYELFAIYWRLRGYELPENEKWDIIRKQKWSLIMKNVADAKPAILNSFPDWMAQRIEAQNPEAWPELATALNQQADLILRTNLLKISREKLIETLQGEGIETEALAFNDCGIRLKNRVNTFRLNSFQDGFYEVQDGGSQLIAPYLEPEPSMRVVDACSGAGGKTLHLAALMQNKGSIIAMDVEGWKLEELKKRARRNGVDTIETRVIDGSKSIKRLENSADRLLLDVPCSGMGVIRRNPDTKWKLKEEHLEKVKSIQREILDTYPAMLKKGGLMVYATCSLLDEENRAQVDDFIERNQGAYTLLRDQIILPQQFNTDGFYMALIRKN